MDKQNVADGQYVRCAYSFDVHSYYCTHRGIVCIDQMVCTDNRTAEDQALQTFMEVWRQEEKRKQDRTDTIVGGTLAGLFGVAIGIGILCCIWRCWKGRESARARSRQRRDRERQDALELGNAAHKEDKRKARLDAQLEEALIKEGIPAAKPGSLEQKELTARLERARLLRRQRQV